MTDPLSSYLAADSGYVYQDDLFSRMTGGSIDEPLVEPPVPYNPPPPKAPTPPPGLDYYSGDHVAPTPRCAISMCAHEGDRLLPLGGAAPGCNHQMHESCLRTLLQTQRAPVCPLCKATYLTQMVRIISSTIAPAAAAPVHAAAPAPKYVVAKQAPAPTAAPRRQQSRTAAPVYDPTPEPVYRERNTQQTKNNGQFTAFVR